MSRMWIAFVMVGLFAAPIGGARAQMSAAGGAPASAGTSTTMPSLGGLGGAAPVDEATQERRNEVDRNYRAVMGTIPAQATAVDPWAGMRGTEEKAAQKPAAKGARTTEKKKPAAQ